MKSLIDNTDLTLDSSIYNIHGLTSPRSQTFLHNIVKEKNVLEIGSFCGASTVAMATNAKKVYTVDNWKETENIAVDSKYSTHIVDPQIEFERNIEPYDNIITIEGDIFSRNVFSSINNIEEHIDVIFYDASHTIEDVIKFLLTYEFMFHDCVLIIDDYNFISVQDAISVCTEQYSKKPIDEYLIKTDGESKDTFWNGLAVQVFI